MKKTIKVEMTLIEFARKMSNVVNLALDEKSKFTLNENGLTIEADWEEA